MSVVRQATEQDFAAIVALNEAFVRYTSPMDLAHLAHLHKQSAFHKVVEADGQVVAFLLVMGAGADYASVNYQWFAARYGQFLYIDRIVIAQNHHGKGLGKTLYQDLFAVAAERGISPVCCEFDVEPLNPVSAAFHAGFNFTEVGRQSVAGGKKQVSLQIAKV